MLSGRPFTGSPDDVNITSIKEGKDMKSKVTYTKQGGASLSIEIEDGGTIEDLLNAVDESSLGRQFAVNGRTADVKTPLEEGDEVAEAKSAKGGN